MLKIWPIGERWTFSIAILESAFMRGIECYWDQNPSFSLWIANVVLNLERDR